MKITTAWIHDGEGPSMVSAYDENTFDTWGREPDFYQKDVQRYGETNELRELVIEIPEGVVGALFTPPVVKAAATTPV